MTGRRTWDGRSRGGRWGNAILAGLIRSPLHHLVPLLLVFISLYFVLASPAGSRASADFAERLGRGGSAWRRFLFVWRHYFTFGTLLVDRFAMLSGHADRYRIERPPRAVLGPAERGTGMVFLSAHVGSWEAMAHLLAHEEAAPINLVIHPGEDPRVAQAVDRGRAFRTIPADGSPQAAASILEALRDGGLVAMMGDRTLGEEGVEVDFLGGRARLPVGPYVVAAAARVPLVLMFAVRTGRRRYRFWNEEFPELRYRDRRDRAADHRRWAQEFARRLERVVREYPMQWSNFFPFWEPPAARGAARA